MTTTDEEPAAASDASATNRQIRGSSLLLSGRFISIGINFLVQVLIARHLTQSDYGAFAYALSMVTLGETLVTLGLDRGVSRFLSIYDEDHDYDRMLGTLVMVVATVGSLGLTLILLVIGLQGLIGETLVSDPVAIGILVILIVLSPIQALDNLLGNVLAVFASARSIFLRKYVLAPLFRLVVVVLLVLGDYGVGFLAAGYVISGALGLLIYGGILWRVLGDRGIRSQFHRGTMRIPGKAIFAFTFPLLTTDLVFIAMNTTDAIFLAHFWGTEEVAAFRVIQPLAGLNTIVFTSFTMLYMPVASRLFARGDRAGVGDLYWRTAIWMAVFSFPIFAVTSSLAGPVTEALYTDRYADSATYLALLSTGYYLNAALGFNGLTLRVYGFIRYTVVINLVTAIANVTLNLLLIPTYGALGAAIATMSTLILHNVLKQIGLTKGTGIVLFDRTYLRVYGVIVAAVIVLAVAQLAFDLHVIVSIALAGVASFLVLALNRKLLTVAEIFPEILRLPFARRVLGG
jgi:O-antigen/teichoic acid export membrane protein